MAVQKNPILGVIAAVASTLPDAIEIVGGADNRDYHRGMSHDVLLWVPVLVSLAFIAHWPGMLSSLPICRGIPPVVSAGVILGVMLHLMTDALSKGGIPVLLKRRIAVGWYKTFTISEYKVSLLICLPSLAIAWALGHLDFRWSVLNGYIRYLCY